VTLEEWREHVKRLETADRRVRKAVRDQKALPGGARNDSPDVPRRRMPKVQRMTSPRQRLAEGQTMDAVKAIFEGDRTPTPVAGPKTVFTTNLGGNCEPLNSGFHGKATTPRTNYKGGPAK